MPEWLAQPRQEKTKEEKEKPRGGVQQVAADVDAELAAYIREWRREAAQKQDVLAFVVMHDSSLEDLCRKRPRSLAELRQVSGFGERKTAVYGGEILAALERFAKGARASQIALPMSNEIRHTLRLLERGHSLEDAAGNRGVKRSTIIEDAAKLVENGSLAFDSRWVAAETIEKIRKAAEKVGQERLGPIKAGLPRETTCDEIRLVVAYLRAQKAAPAAKAAAAS